MKITIIGWYGTETIWDRAILAGIISFLGKSKLSSLDIRLWSLFPFFSERTLFEDIDFLKDIAWVDLKISIFDSSSSNQLKSAIKSTELLIMWWWPLMHIDPLFMVDYAFSLAKHYKKKTAILGCGIWPLFGSKFKKSVLSILSKSDLIILRDELSRKNLFNIVKEQGADLSLDSIFVSYDPAVEACLLYKIKNIGNTINLDITDNSYIAINLREFPSEYSRQNISESVNKKIKYLLENIMSYGKPLYCISMWYFFMSSDDKDYYYKLLESMKFSNDKPIILNKNLSLVESMYYFEKSDFCFGMRFHSVIFQTLLNGNNYVIDYTEPKIGKISWFLSWIDSSWFYDDRYINIQDIDKCVSFSLSDEKKSLNFHKIELWLKKYVDLLNKLL